jgi:hypothetical protein
VSLVVLPLVHNLDRSDTIEAEDLHHVAQVIGCALRYNGALPRVLNGAVCGYGRSRLGYDSMPLRVLVVFGAFCWCHRSAAHPSHSGQEANEKYRFQPKYGG